MRKLFTVAVAFLVVACGGTGSTNATEVRSSQSAEASLATSDWVRYELATFEPGQFVFPMDCIGQHFMFVGTIWIEDHLVPNERNSTTHENYRLYYDPPQFVSVETGDTWIMRPGMNNRGVIKWGDLSFTVLVSAEEHEKIPFENVETGERATEHLSWHFALTNTGETRFDRWEFFCTVP